MDQLHVLALEQAKADHPVVLGAGETVGRGADRVIDVQHGGKYRDVDAARASDLPSAVAARRRGCPLDRFARRRYVTGGREHGRTSWANQRS